MSCIGSCRFWPMPGAFALARSRSIIGRAGMANRSTAFRGSSRGFSTCSTVRFLTTFRQRPLHILGGSGLAMLSIGALGLLYLAILWVLGDRPIGTRPLLFYSIAFVIVGVQLLSLGILAELVTAYNIRAHETYSVAERIEPPSRSPAFDAKVPAGELDRSPLPPPHDPGPMH